MFGYVKTDMPYLYVKDTILYKAMYCGLCKSIGKYNKLLLNNKICLIRVELVKQNSHIHSFVVYG